MRVMEKQRDRNLKWLAAIQDEERKDVKDQRLPMIECIDFDRYEESYEEKNLVKLGDQRYTNFLQTQDVNIGKIMERARKKKKDDQIRDSKKR